MAAEATKAARVFLLDDESRDEMFDLIKEHGLDVMAEEVPLTPVTLSKAVGGHAVGGNTILAIQEYLAQDEEDDDEPSDSGDDPDWVRLFCGAAIHSGLDHLTRLSRGFGAGSGSGILPSS